MASVVVAEDAVGASWFSATAPEGIDKGVKSHFAGCNEMHPPHRAPVEALQREEREKIILENNM